MIFHGENAITTSEDGPKFGPKFAQYFDKYCKDLENEIENNSGIKK